MDGKIHARAPRAVRSDAAPAALGPYSQAIDTGACIYVSGQLGVDPASGKLVGSAAGSQADQAIRNIGAILDAAGLGFGDVVKTTVYLADMADFAAVNEIYSKYFTSKPARSCCAVRSLPKGALVEIEAIAVKRGV